MSKHKLEIDCKCRSCKATGLYVGCGERDGAAVVCSACKGTGKQRIIVEYEDFFRRESRDDVRRVYRTGSGIIIGEDSGRGLFLEDFGGLTYEEWISGKEFAPGTEDRTHTCPAWFYQSADYNKKPNWDECGWGGTFSSCKHFCTKASCWARWDREFATPAGETESSTA